MDRRRRAHGTPQDPTDAQLDAIRGRQGLERLEPDRREHVRDGGVTLQVSLPLPSVSLVEIGPAG